MGGLSGGIIWGCVVAVVGLAAVSLSTPLPPRSDRAPVEVAAETDPLVEDAAPDGAEPEEIAAAEIADAPAAPVSDAEAAEDDASDLPATEVPLPSGSEFNRPPPEPEAAIPAADAPPSAFIPAAPLIANESSIPRFDTAPAAQPDVTAEAPTALSADAEPGAAPDGPATDARPSVADGPAPLGQPEASETPTIATARLPQITPDGAPEADAAPVEPEADAAPVEPEAVTEDVAPIEEAATPPDPAPAVEPEAAPEEEPTPEVDLAEETEISPDAEAAPEADAASDADLAEAPETATEAEPAADLSTETETPDAPASETADVADAEAPEAPAAPAFPTISAAPSSETVMPSVDTATLSTPLFPQSSTLPQVAIAPSATPDPAPVLPDETLATDPAEDAADPDTPPRAIIDFAAPFDATDDRPLMAIVLIDEADSRIELTTLLRFSFPVAFAIDPLHPQAEERAAAYREAGFEVVILGSMIPDGATPSDLEVALTSARTTLPEAVALLDSTDGRIQGDRPILDATVAALAETGHGLLAFPRGLNAAEQSASRSGVPGATLFRLLDDEDQRATVITRFLARAAFTASQEGTVIVAGHTRPDTVTALFSWALGDRSEAVAIAPLSATLLRASGL